MNVNSASMQKASCRRFNFLKWKTIVHVSMIVDWALTTRCTFQTKLPVHTLSVTGEFEEPIILEGQLKTHSNRDVFDEYPSHMMRWYHPFRSFSCVDTSKACKSFRVRVENRFRSCPATLDRLLLLHHPQYCMSFAKQTKHTIIASCNAVYFYFHAWVVPLFDKPKLSLFFLVWDQKSTPTIDSVHVPPPLVCTR